MSMMAANTFNPGARGYHAVYREHQINHCPGCGRTHWLVGRTSAECAFCCTALPLALGFSEEGPPAILTRGKGGGKVQ